MEESRNPPCCLLVLARLIPRRQIHPTWFFSFIFGLESPYSTQLVQGFLTISHQWKHKQLHIPDMFLFKSSEYEGAALFHTLILSLEKLLEVISTSAVILELCALILCFHKSLPTELLHNLFSS